MKLKIPLDLQKPQIHNGQMTTTTVPGRDKLTLTQARIYDYLVGYFDENDQLPSSRVVANNFGYRSQTAAMCHINALRKKGWISHNAAGFYKFNRPIIRPAFNRPQIDA